jgi:hypothetical protein
MNQRFKHAVACSSRSENSPQVSKSFLVAVRRHRRLTATTFFVREAAEGESTGIVCLKNFGDDQIAPGGRMYSPHFKGIVKIPSIVANCNADADLRVDLRWTRKLYRPISGDLGNFGRRFTRKS